MVILREKHGKYIFLFALILIQIFNCDAKIKCVQCGGGATACVGSEQPTDCTDEKVENCFTQIANNGVIERGCRKPDQKDTCKVDNTTNCVLTGDSGNTQRICKKCDGINAQCSQTNMSTTDIKDNEICAAIVKNCFMKVDNKLVVRGCDADTAKCNTANENTCKTCPTDNCNTGIFPTNRINCYQCSGANCKEVKPESGLSQPCLNYVENDECYTKGEDIRGCKSDTKDNKCLATDAQDCVYCNTTACNNQIYKFTCIRCRNDVDPLCWNDPTKLKNKTTDCTATAGCFHGIWHDVAIRGCMTDASLQVQATCQDKNNQQKCTICHEKDCNTKKSSGVKNGLSYALILIVFMTLWKLK